MFKKHPAIKTSNALKSSERRLLLLHLRHAYPVLAHAPDHVLARLVPASLRVVHAVISTAGGAEDRCAIYREGEGGSPLWFELGGRVGVAIQAARSGKKAGGKGGGTGTGAGKMEGEVIPTLYALWIHPFILPQLPTWTAVIEDHLLGGSALMVPGLRAAPHTFRACPLRIPAAAAAAAERPGSSTTTTTTTTRPPPAPLPQAHTLVAITDTTSPLPLVVARLEQSGEHLVALRSAPGGSGKGRAARVVHAYRDTLWEMGGRGRPPVEGEVDWDGLVKKEGEGGEDGQGQGKGKEEEKVAPNGEQIEQEDTAPPTTSEEPAAQAQEEEEEEEDLAAALEAVLMGTPAHDDDSEAEEDDVKTTAAGATGAGRGRHQPNGKGKGAKGKKQHEQKRDVGSTSAASYPMPPNGDNEHDPRATGDGEPHPHPTLSPALVDITLRLALLNGMAALTPESASALLPVPASSLYSGTVLPNRPTHLPPRVGKGKGKARAPWAGWTAWAARSGVDLAEVDGGADGEGEMGVVPDEADVKRSRAKQLKKWIKAAEKDGLLKTKDVRGELTVVDLNFSHSELQGWTPIWTLSDEAAKAAAEHAPEEGDPPAGSSSSSATKTRKNAAAADRTGIFLQLFYGAKSEATRELFEVMDLPPDSVQCISSIRAALSEYITKRALAHPTNQALVRVGDDPALVRALTAADPAGKSSKKKKKEKDDDAAAVDTAEQHDEGGGAGGEMSIKPMRRDELARRLQDVLQEYHRLSFLRASLAQAIGDASTRSDPLSSALLESDAFRARLRGGGEGEGEEGGERVGTLTKGKPAPISMSIKQRQGRKTVTLLSNLEPFGVDPKRMAAELAREVGAATSVSALVGSTARRPRSEVLVQGDVRKAVLKWLEEEVGVDVGRMVSVKDEVGGRRSRRAGGALFHRTGLPRDGR